MWKIYPDENKTQTRTTTTLLQEETKPTVLTVWKRSSMSFQGTDGFMVFDKNGTLVFRLDNYSRKSPSSIILMDGDGKALLTLRTQFMQFQWKAYNGENAKKLFSMRASSYGKDEAEVFMAAGSTKQADFKVHGSFRSRNCKITTSNGEVAAKIARKRANNTTILLSDDVFSLVVQPGFDSQIIMAFIVILDRICNKPYTPLCCS
ncbi:hypothetical protein ACFE04_001534 [Oxalis oulophora]